MEEVIKNKMALNKQNRVLFISCGALVLGGAERVISILSHPLSSHYERVVIIEWIEATRFYDVNPKVDIVNIETECGSKSLFKKMLWFRRYVKQSNPDLILSFLYPWSIKLLASLILNNSKVVVAERQDPRKVKGGFFTKLLRDILYIKAIGILVQTEENRRYYPFWLRKKTYTIYNPIMMNRELVGSAFQTDKENSIVTVGRLSVEKNHFFLIDSFIEFYRDHPEYKLLIYGDGVLRHDLEKYVSDKIMAGAILFKGNTKDVFSCIKNASVFVLPSKYEGMPNALIEAMSLGLPCISTKVSGATELIHDGINGILVDVDDKSQMVNALNFLVSNRDIANVYAQRATEVYSLTNSDIIFDKWIKYIDSKIN